MDDPGSPASAEGPASGGSDRAAARGADLRCPPFAPSLLRRQLALDGALIWALRAVLLVAMWVALFDAGGLVHGHGGIAMMLILLALAWVLHGRGNTRAAGALPHITELVEAEDEAAESALAQSLRLRPLSRAVRILLYHRLAVWRHRRQHFAEAGAICQAILGERLGSAGQVRPHLLLILADSRLQLGDLWGAWYALRELQGCRLSLTELLQLLALQTRYAIDAGYDSVALHHLGEKIAMIELMPAPQCGMLHALLALAARRAGHDQRARWLQRRAELLCTAPQLVAIGHPPPIDGRPGPAPAVR